MRDIGMLIALTLIAAIVGAGILFENSTPHPAIAAEATTTAPSEVQTATASSSVPVPFTVLASGEHATVMARTNYLIATQDQFDAVWKMTDQTVPEPAIDFSKNFVLAVFAGDEPSADYDIGVTNVNDAASERMVVVKISAPQAGCALTGSTTEPYQLIELSATTKSYAHQDVHVTTSCS